jgi:hypothetical protein
VIWQSISETWTAVCDYEPLSSSQATTARSCLNPCCIVIGVCGFESSCAGLV